MTLTPALSADQFNSLLDWAVNLTAEASESPDARTLTGEERAFAEALNIKGRVLVWLVDRMPEPPEELRELYESHMPNPAGLTLGHLILVRKDAYSPRLMRHELVHVVQVERKGGIRQFLHDYVGEIVEYGYAKAPLEIEARSKE